MILADDTLHLGLIAGRFPIKLMKTVDREFFVPHYEKVQTQNSLEWRTH